MSVRLLLFLMGRLSILLGGALCVPLLFYFFVPEGRPEAFAIPAAVLLAAGGWILRLGELPKTRLGVRESSFFLGLTWLLLAFAGMLPYVIDGQLGWLDAAFESISNFTTTGATCVVGDMPRPLLLWRSITEWLGGLSAMVLLVTVMPQVSGIFGISFALGHTISLSPMLSRMRRTGFRIARIYAGLTVIIFLCYMLAGLELFDAVNWAMITLSTSGCYPTDTLLAFHSLPLEFAAVLGMLLASGNLVLYWNVLRCRDIRLLRQNAELKTFLGIVAACGLFIALHLWYLQIYDFRDSLRYGFFQAVSFASTTGYEAVDLSAWPDFDKYVLFLLTFIGGCIGAPAGGFKVLRILVLFRAAFAEMRRTLHPRMILHIAIDGHSVPMEIVVDILGFFFLYFAIFFLFMLLIAFSGVPLLDAMGIAAACINGMGAATVLYGTQGDFVSLSALTKSICCLLMILGKLEIFAFLLVLQTSVRALRNRW